LDFYKKFDLISFNKENAMRLLILGFLMFSSSFASATADSIPPTGSLNPIYLEENLDLRTITKSEFLTTLSLARKIFAPLAATNNRKLEIFSDWNSDWTQAFARRWDTDQILIYGGIARITAGTQDSLALLICHELGHLYGGIPYSDEHNQLSAEGQADWWATNYCWSRFSEQLPSTNPDSKDRALRAALVVTAFYAKNRNIPAPLPNTPDSTVVEETVLTHPEPQCRLDTYLAGLINNPRPLCWWKEPLSVP
jgi:hypothetical protein